MVAHLIRILFFFPWIWDEPLSLFITGTRTLKSTFPVWELSIKINKCTGGYLFMCFLSSFQTPPPSKSTLYIFCVLSNTGVRCLRTRVQSWVIEVGCYEGVSGVWGGAFITSHSEYRDHIIMLHFCSQKTLWLVEMIVYHKHTACRPRTRGCRQNTITVFVETSLD